MQLATLILAAGFEVFAILALVQRRGPVFFFGYVISAEIWAAATILQG